MSDLPENYPWQKGNWFSEQLPFLIWIVEGDKMEGKNMISLDYPDIKGSFPGKLKFGDFGPARKEISDVTGVDYYNIEITYFGVVKVYGFVNENGTEITSWGQSNSVEIIKWLSPQEIEVLKGKREDINAPR